MHHKSAEEAIKRKRQTILLPHRHWRPLLFRIFGLSLIVGPVAPLMGNMAWRFVNISCCEINGYDIFRALERSYQGLLALLGARTLLGAPGIATNGIFTTSNKELLGAPGIKHSQVKYYSGFRVDGTGIPMFKTNGAPSTPPSLGAQTRHLLSI